MEFCKDEESTRFRIKVRSSVDLKPVPAGMNRDTQFCHPGIRLAGT